MNPAESDGVVFGGRGIVAGRATGDALVSLEPLSFLGDLDIRSGVVVGDLPSIRGQSVAGRVLVMPFSRGSAGAWRFLYQLAMHHTNPVALVFRGWPDPSVVQGAILSEIPVVGEVDPDLWTVIGFAESCLTVDGSRGTIEIEPR